MDDFGCQVELPGGSWCRRAVAIGRLCAGHGDRLRVLGSVQADVPISRAKYQRRPFDWERVDRDVLDGLLLGDGSLVLAQHRGSAFFALSSKHRDNVEWAVERCPGLGLRVSQDRRGIWNGVSSQGPGLVEEWRRWYGDPIAHRPGGLRKRIPPDLQLTRDVVLAWYLGDGSLVRHPDGRIMNVALYTQGFARNDVRRLAVQLSELTGLPWVVHQDADPKCRGLDDDSAPGYMSLHLRMSHIQAFFEWLGPCPVAGLSHRWARASDVSALTRARAFAETSEGIYRLVAMHPAWSSRRIREEIGIIDSRRIRRIMARAGVRRPRAWDGGEVRRVIEENPSARPEDLAVRLGNLGFDRVSLARVTGVQRNARVVALATGDPNLTQAQLADMTGYSKPRVSEILIAAGIRKGSRSEALGIPLWGLWLSAPSG